MKQRNIVIGAVVVMAVGLAASRAIPHPRPAATAPRAVVTRALAPSPVIESNATLDAGSLAAPPPRTLPAVPSAEVLALDREYWMEHDRHPTRVGAGDAYDVVTRRHRMDVQTLMAAIAEVSNVRIRAKAEASRALADQPGVDVVDVEGSSLGNTTLSLRVMIPGCSPNVDYDRGCLPAAQALLVTLVLLLHDHVDSYRASLWCEDYGYDEPHGSPNRFSAASRRLSYSATWTRDGNDLSIR